jgi:hypothetical protein
MGRRPWELLAGLVGLLAAAAAARADGGAVRLARPAGGYDLTVFSSPTPLRAGPVDLSVLVQDRATGDLIPESRVNLRVEPADRPEAGWDVRATREAATNKLYQDARFELPGPGAYLVTVTVEGPHGPATASFRVEAAAPLPRWSEMGLWIALPVVPVVLFAAHQARARRARTTRP